MEIGLPRRQAVCGEEIELSRLVIRFYVIGVVYDRVLDRLGRIHNAIPHVVSRVLTFRLRLFTIGGGACMGIIGDRMCGIFCIAPRFFAHGL